ncbi:MAG: DUF6146 family protein [Bacteroidales bacterium]
MKKTFFIILVILVVSQTVALCQKKVSRESLKADTVTADSVEYRLIITDPGFDFWLATKPPRDFYSNDYYAQKNRFYVTEWNLMYSTIQNKDLYDNYIDYKPFTDYGIDINYRLYYYFRYFEEINHVKLLDFNR